LIGSLIILRVERQDDKMIKNKENEIIIKYLIFKSLFI